MSRVRGFAAAFALAWLALPSLASAHPVGFGVLQLEARADGDWDVLLRVSGSRERAEAVEAVLPEGCEETSPPTWEEGTRGFDRRFVAHCPSPLVGELGASGIGPDLSMSLRVVHENGETELAILDSATPTVRLEDGARLGGSVFAAYAALGVEHILTGIDHLLFVLGLLLLLRHRRRALILTITSFTVGHSATLGLATLGFVPIATGAAEAIIALSILLLAVELTMSGAPPTLTRRYPGVVAGGFGLVHGLGFAGALADVGLPRDDALTALFAFNVGVEVGQLLFVGAVLLLTLVSARALRAPDVARARLFAVYVMGAASMYFVLERVAAFV